jgi:hypothetical protein
MEQATQVQPIRLSFESREQVLVIPDDEDRFVTTAAEAARACKQADDSREWQKQFNEFLKYLHKWCDDNSNRIESGYVSVGDSGLNVLLVLSSEGYDFDFEDEIVELDLALARDFPLCTSEVMQVPKPCAVESETISPEAICVYGNSRRT